MSKESNLTLGDVAKLLGVSRTTMSNAYNRPDQLSERLREEIIERARSLGYHGPNPAGRLLRTGKTKSIGLLFYDRFSRVFEDEFAVQLIKGITAELEIHGVSLLMVPTMTTDDEINNALGALVDGFIVFTDNQEANPVLEMIRSRGLPLVSIDNRYGNAPMVGVDDYAGAKQAANQVIKAGHEKVIILSLAFSRNSDRGFIELERIDRQSDITAVRRAMGYRRSFDDAGVDYRFYEISDSDFNMPAMVDIADEVLDNLCGATVVLCMADHLALQLIRAAHRRGLKVPEDLSVVGFDGIPSGQEHYPILSTVCQKADEKGRAAVRMLLGKQQKQDTILSVSWLEGETLAKPKLK